MYAKKENIYPAYSLVPNRRPPLLITFSNFFQPGHSYSSIVSEPKNRAKYGEGHKILTPKQMLQRLPIALGQVKAGNISENLLNEIRQIIYSLVDMRK